MPKIGHKPGGTVDAGYGQAHRAERARRMAYLRAHPGGLSCPRCGRPVFAEMKLHLDHDDHDRSKWLPGLSCQPCNTSNGARLGHARQGHRTRRAVTRQPAVPEYTYDRSKLPVW